MAFLKAFATVLIGVSFIGLSGCGGQTARSQSTAPPKATISNTGHGGSGNQASPSSFRPKQSLRKYSTHEAFLSSYHAPEYGISFRYPRNYSLQEEGVDEEQAEAPSQFLKRQADLDEEQPGAKLVATVLVPEDAYPNTTFEHASVQLVVNEAGTEKSCNQTVSTAVGGHSLKLLTVQGISFGWNEQDSDSEAIKLRKRVYGGYSGGTCYEFFLTVAADEVADADSVNRAADLGKIMRHLQEIVESIHVSAPIGTEDGGEKADRL